VQGEVKHDAGLSQKSMCRISSFSRMAFVCEELPIYK